jgi:predicted TPR repeat methyltransferase
VQIYQMVTRLAPGSPRVWANLGEAYEAAGRDRDAIGAYERVLELDPDDEMTQVILDRLRRAEERSETEPGP